MSGGTDIESGDVVLQIHDDELCPPTDDSSINSASTIKISDDGNKKDRSLRSIPLVELSLENITYAPSTRSAKAKSRREILSNVTAKVSPYKLNAWMGPSGSGKSYLSQFMHFGFLLMSELNVFSIRDGVTISKARHLFSP